MNVGIITRFQINWGFQLDSAEDCFQFETFKHESLYFLRNESSVTACKSFKFRVKPSEVHCLRMFRLKPKVLMAFGGLSFDLLRKCGLFWMYFWRTLHAFFSLHTIFLKTLHSLNLVQITVDHQSIRVAEINSDSGRPNSAHKFLSSYRHQNATNVDPQHDARHRARAPIPSSVEKAYMRKPCRDAQSVERFVGKTSKEATGLTLSLECVIIHSHWCVRQVARGVRCMCACDAFNDGWYEKNEAENKTRMPPSRKQKLWTSNLVYLFVCLNTMTFWFEVAMICQNFRSRLNCR